MFPNDRWYTVKDMVEHAREEELPLLSTFNHGETGDFWEEYRNNYTSYDNFFKILYKSYRFFDQDIEDVNHTLNKVTGDFTSAVYEFLNTNKKKYEELYRVQILQDTDYDMLGNINYQRQETNTMNSNGSNVYGQRQDTINTTLGARIDTSEEKVSAFNDDDYTSANKTTDNKGQQQDSETSVKGAETDTTSNASIGSVNVTVKGKDNSKSNASSIREHISVWDKYEFYGKIFRDIAVALLLVD